MMTLNENYSHLGENMQKSENKCDLNPKVLDIRSKTAYNGYINYEI
tara:strand:+ start:317 stop:454 length:138 start_codon:yes stop_codon:yes gene_type:complete